MTTLDLAALKRTAEATKGKPLLSQQVIDYYNTFNIETTSALIARAEQADALEAERDAAQRWARAWKALCKRINRESNASLSKTLRLITKENPRSAEVAYTGLMLMAAFANDQGDDESVEECAFRVVAERDRLQAHVSAMCEAMGEEWIPIGIGWNPAHPDALHCPECLNQPRYGHKADCSRGRFFAALAAQEAQT